MGKVVLNTPLLLPTALVTGNQATGGVKFVVAYNPQSLAHPGQLIATEFAFTLIPSAGNGRNTPTAAEFAPAPQASVAAIM